MSITPGEIVYLAGLLPDRISLSQKLLNGEVKIVQSIGLFGIGGGAFHLELPNGDLYPTTVIRPLTGDVAVVSLQIPNFDAVGSKVSGNVVSSTSNSDFFEMSFDLDGA